VITKSVGSARPGPGGCAAWPQAAAATCSGSGGNATVMMLATSTT
jgi:hypothetical protein